jgi:hypothetical protein
MKRSKFTESQITFALKLDNPVILTPQSGDIGVRVEEVCRKKKKMN